MFENLKVKIMKAVYHYHHRKANELYDQLCDKADEGKQSEKLWSDYRYHANEELRLVEEIYLLKGIC